MLGWSAYGLQSGRLCSDWCLGHYQFRGYHLKPRRSGVTIISGVTIGKVRAWVRARGDCLPWRLAKQFWKSCATIKSNAAIKGNDLIIKPDGSAFHIGLQPYQIPQRIIVGGESWAGSSRKTNISIRLSLRWTGVSLFRTVAATKAKNPSPSAQALPDNVEILMTGIGCPC